MASNTETHYDYDYTRYMRKSGFKSGDSTEVAKKIPVAVLGLGRAGIIHLENLTSIPRFHIRYIVDNSPARLQTIKNNYCLDERTTLLDGSQVNTIYNDKDVVAVIVATPSYDHERYVYAALMAGKHVLCEKPVALDIESISKCYRAARENNKSLMCAFNRRYDPSYLTIQNRILAGEIGQVHAVHTVARDSPKPTLEYLKISGGIFHDCVVHDIDLICNFILRERPTSVIAVTHAFDKEIAKLNDFDTVCVTLKFGSGAIGNISIAREAVYGYDQRLEVIGDAGMLRSENIRPDAVICSQKSGCTLTPILHSFPSRYKEAYTRELENFLDIIDGKTGNSVTEKHVLDCLHIIEALEESVKTGTMVDVKYVN